MQVLNAVGSMIVTGAVAVESIFGAINEGALALNELAQKGHKHAANLNAQTDLVLELTNQRLVGEIAREITKLVKKGTNPEALLVRLQRSSLKEDDKALFKRCIIDAGIKFQYYSEAEGYAKLGIQIPAKPVAKAPAPTTEYIM